MDLSRRSFRASAGWYFARTKPSSSRPSAAASQHGTKRRSIHSRRTLRCVSKHEGELNRTFSSFETRARAFEFARLLRHARSSGCGRAASTEELSIHTAYLVHAAHFCARGCQLCFTHPESRGGRSAEKRSGAAAPVGRAHNAARQAPSEAPCVP